MRVKAAEDSSVARAQSPCFSKPGNLQPRLTSSCSCTPCCTMSSSSLLCMRARPRDWMYDCLVGGARGAGTYSMVAGATSDDNLCQALSSACDDV